LAFFDYLEIMAAKQQAESLQQEAEMRSFTPGFLLWNRLHIVVRLSQRRCSLPRNPIWFRSTMAAH
jgi:hypothetical protein